MCCGFGIVRPFANHHCVVPGTAEYLTEVNTFVISDVIPILNACLVIIQAGEQCCPARAANRTVIELAEANSVMSQTVNIWRLDLATVATEVGEPQIIRHHDDDIRPGRRIRGRADTDTKNDAQHDRHR